MSHFVVAAILPKNCMSLAVEATVDELLAPYSESLEVDPYEHPCYCVGLEAEREVREKVKEQFGEIDAVRDAYWKLPEEERTDAKWKELIALRVKMTEELLEVHPLKTAPNPKCDECDGTGVYMSTYNPKSKWDWYVIGGRWDGWIFGPEREEASQDGQGGFNFNDEHHTIKNNLRPVKNLLADIKAGKIHSPFAILLPNGEWIEKGEMGWWGMVRNETDQDNWDTHVETILSKFVGHKAIALDCHI